MRFAVVLLLTLAGCASHAPMARVETVCWSRSLAGGVELWRAEFRRAYHADPIIVCCHGGDRNGRWVLHTDDGQFLDAESVVAALHQMFKDRMLLVLSCNPGHHRLRTPHTYFALRSIWSRPGADRQFDLRDCAVEDCAGSIQEFIESR